MKFSLVGFILKLVSQTLSVKTCNSNILSSLDSNRVKVYSGKYSTSTAIKTGVENVDPRCHRNLVIHNPAGIWLIFLATDAHFVDGDNPSQWITCQLDYG